MTMDATRLGHAIVDGMIAVPGSSFSAAQETATKANMVALAQAVIDEIQDYYSGGGGGTPSDDDPQPLGTADPGVSALYSRGDHVHEMPDAADVGADPIGTAATAITTHLSAAPHVALSSSTPAALGVAAVGVGTTSARADHVHAMPSAADVGALSRSGANSPSANINWGGYRITNLGSAVSGSDATTLDQVNALLEGRAFQDPVISATTGTPPASPTTGDRYVVPVGAGGAWAALDDLIVEWDGATWDQTTPVEGTTVAVQDSGTFLRYNDAYPAGSWTNLGSAVDHAALINRAWAASGHTGTASRLAAFDGSGAATYAQVGADVQAYSLALTELAAAYSTSDNWLALDLLSAGNTVSIGLDGTGPTPRLRGSGTLNSAGSVAEPELLLDHTSNFGTPFTIHTRALGTPGSKSTVASGTPLGSEAWWGHNGTTFKLAATQAVEVDAALSGGTPPARIIWSLRNSSGTYAERMRLNGAALTMSVPLAFNNSGDASSTFDAIKQVATSTSAGAVELSTWLEGQTATTARVDDARDWWSVYGRPAPWSGSWWANRVAAAITAGGAGILSALTASAGTFTKAHSTVYGPYWSVAQATGAGSERALYPTLVNNAWTFDEAKYVRHIIWLGAATVSTSRVLYGWAVSGGTLTTPATTTRHVAAGIWEGALQLRAADGTTAATPVAFSTTPTDGTIYAIELIPQSATSVLGRLYTWDISTGLTWVEDKTISSNIPSGSGVVVPVWVARSSSGTPSAFLAGWLTTINKTVL